MKINTKIWIAINDVTYAATQIANWYATENAVLDAINNATNNATQGATYDFLKDI